jgi:hypothetical protein
MASLLRQQFNGIRSFFVLTFVRVKTTSSVPIDGADQKVKLTKISFMAEVFENFARVIRQGSGLSHAKARRFYLFIFPYFFLEA